MTTPQWGGGLIPDRLDDWFTRSVAPVIRRLILARVHPNAITVAAFLLTAAGGACVADGRLLTAFGLIVAGGILDFSDGKVAALTGRVTVYGGILDSTLDRYADAAVYLGLAVYFGRGGYPLTAFAALVALVGSMTTSYLMAVGRAHGYTFRTGLLRRQDRVTVISAALVLTVAHEPLVEWLGLGDVPVLPLGPVVWLLAALTNVTAFQRLALLRRVAGGQADAPDQGETLRDRQLRALRTVIGPSDRGGPPHA